MKTKTRLMSVAIGFMLILALLITGVYALDKAEVNLGGNLTFSASGVYAKVTGTVSGAVEDVEDKTVTFDNGSADAPVNWNEDLSFDGGEEITYTITVENLSDRTIYVSATDTADIVNNVTKSMANGAFVLDEYETQSITIKMRVSNINISLTNARYDYKIELMDEASVPETNPDEAYNGIYLSEGVVTGWEEAQVVVPAFHKENGVIYPVTTIGEYFVDDDETFISINFPQTLTTIEENAFASANGVIQLVIPSKVESIGPNKFGYSLSNIVVDENNLYYDSRNNCNALIETETNILLIGCCNTIIPEGVKGIGDFAFVNCYNSMNLVIPKSVQTIGDSAFQGCAGLTSVKISDSVEVIGDSAFWGCSGLTNITIPKSVKSILTSTFRNCIKLTSITIADTITSIGDSAFQGCSGLTSVTIPDSVEAIGDSAFQDCSGLTSVTIPDSVEAIGKSVFEGCDGLTRVTIGNSVTSISDRAFCSCSGLVSITIPSSVTNIGENAFWGLGALTDVYYTGSEEQWNAITIDSSNSYLVNATKHFNHGVA